MSRDPSQELTVQDYAVYCTYMKDHRVSLLLTNCMAILTCLKMPKHLATLLWFLQDPRFFTCRSLYGKCLEYSLRGVSSAEAGGVLVSLENVKYLCMLCDGGSRLSCLKCEQ